MPETRRDRCSIEAEQRLGPYAEEPFGCPTCRTILNPEAAGGCLDGWHAANQPTVAGYVRGVVEGCRQTYLHEIAVALRIAEQMDALPGQGQGAVHERGLAQRLARRLSSLDAGQSDPYAEARELLAKERADGAAEGRYEMRQRIAAYIDRAAERKWVTARQGLLADEVVAGAYATVAGWCREDSIWVESDDD